MCIKLINNLTAVFSFLSLSFITVSQSDINLNIEWKEAKQIQYEGVTYSIPDFKDSDFDGGKPVMYYTEKLKKGTYELEMESYTTTAALKGDRLYFDKISLKLSSDLQCEYKVTQAGDEYYAAIHLFPFIMENGILKRISTIKFTLKEKDVSTNILKDFALSSVLMPGSGTWYKISVKKDGIYKIDKAFLESCGINTSGLNPDHINIYGNGDGKLPETNSIPRTDDLAKNAIYIEGDSDGSFDDNDYILFYGWGPNRWTWDGGSTFDQTMNIYSTVSCYFININSADIPLRITDIPSSVSPPNQTVTSYSFFDIHESDFVSLVKAGQRWYGELFDTDLERTFNFSVPNIVTSEQANFKVAIGTNASSTAGTEQRYSVNGTVIGSLALPAVSTDWVRSSNSFNLTNPPANIPFKINITRNNPNVLVYLDRILLNARRNLVFMSTQFNFRDINSVGAGNTGEFNITSFPTNGFVWDVTNRHIPGVINGTLASGTFTFVQDVDSLREFVVSNGSDFLLPDRVGTVDYQNLHAFEQAELLIVTHANFLSQANRLADLHRSEGLTVNVATTEQIYNEFSSGMVDATAIRMFAKMFFDRSVSNPTNQIRNLLLFGDGTYDPKNRVANNNYYIPTYQFHKSEDHIGAMVSDDYFGLLSDNDSIAPVDMVDIGVGRILVTDNTTAKEQVDKIEHYLKNGSSLYNANTSNCCCDENGNSSTFGDWRMNYVQIADDEEEGYFINFDTEPQYDTVKLYNPEMNCDKLYCDAYTQVTTAGGQRYPDVYDAITNRVERGTLVINYVGHGGEVGLAEERIVTIPQIQSWKNIDKLNVFVSATCEFTKYDDPSRISAGEWVALNPFGGAIALMTTSRSVYFGVNTLTGKRFYQYVFKRDANNLPMEFGEIMRLTKNGSGSSDNKRSFTLIGDPALRIALPEMKVITDSINGISPTVEIDTIRALSKVTIKGHIEDFDGNTLSGFNGTLSPSVYDKPKTQSTLGQDEDSPVIPFEIQKNIVYKGKATVSNGYFEFTFVVPKDINLSFGNGKISYYAENGNYDAGGYDIRFMIGGIDTSGVDDNTGPDIDIFLNDEQFVNGGITDETPILLVNLFDENGINTVGNGIGHDLTAIIDGNSASPIVLNDYYVADMDSYQSGTVQYSLPELSPGPHTLTVKVWDVNNNSSESTVDFVVNISEDVVLEHVLNYPNPFTTKTEFYFEHNQACSDMDVQIQVLTVSGRLVKTINKTVSTKGFRSEGILWDGKDDFGDQLAKGVYVYRVKVKTPEGKFAEKLEKLVLLK